VKRINEEQDRSERPVKSAQGPNPMSAYSNVQKALRMHPRRWVVTGGAGFIGSHLVEALLGLDQQVVILDNFSTGHERNIQAVRVASGIAADRLMVVGGDIRDPEACLRAIQGSDVVLHQAALGSVPRSIENPMATHDVNVTGFLNILNAARAAGVKRVVYASSSSVYGDHPALPKIEENVGRQLSPYAASKYSNEVYANGFANAYGLELLGLRYFNVFGPRQDPNGAYAAVMPRWFSALLRGDAVTVFGDGETSRDFCYVANVVQANILAATTTVPEACGQAYNVACGERTSLTDLFGLIREQVVQYRADAATSRLVHHDFRRGDVRHSLADVSKASRLLGYQPTHSIRHGLVETASWYAQAADASKAAA